MTTYDIVHLLLYAAGGKIQGRTKLQKFVYFAAALSGLSDNLGYRAHYYGPYSPEVAGAVDDLRSLRFLEQHTSSSGVVDPQGFEVARYDFTLTEEGKQIAEEKAKEHSEVWNRIKAAVEKLQQTKEENYVKLSIAAKAFYLFKEKCKQQSKSVSVTELVEMMPKHGWRVPPEQIEEAGKWLSKIGLITIATVS